MALGFRPETLISHKAKAPRANCPRGLHLLARPTGFEPTGKARALAEGLEALVRALDGLLAEMPQAGSAVARERQPPAREGELWSASEVARYLKTSRSWVYQAIAAGRRPSLRVGAPFPGARL